MITISSHVQEWINRNPFLRQQLGEGLINHSALARVIAPDIEEAIGETVSREAVTIALNRIGKQIAASARNTSLNKFVGDTSLQTGLTIIVVRSQPAIELPVSHSDYFMIARGIWHTVIITKKKTVETLGINKDQILEMTENAAGLTVRLEPGNLDVPGVCAFVLQGLAVRGVNLLEVVSAHDEITVFVNHSEVQYALRALLSIKTETYSQALR